MTTNSFTISRVFDAPRAQVFNCWVEPTHFEKWFAPANCESRLLSADVRPGGHYNQEVLFPDGTRFLTRINFREINPIDLLVFVTSFCNDAGELTKHPFMPLWPDHLLTHVTFEDVGKDVAKGEGKDEGKDEGAGTRVTVVWDPIDASADEVECFYNSQPSCYAGWTGTFDRLESFLAG